MHHAYVLVGAPDQALAYLNTVFKIKALPLFIPQFGITHSREFKEFQSRRLPDGEQQFVVICLNQITLEAQNALLKTLEEPTPGFHFFLVVPEWRQLLPTLLSRVELVKLGRSNLRPNYPDPGRFLAAAPEERLKLVAEFLAEHEGDGQLRNLAQQFGAALLKQKRTAELDRSVAFLYDRAALPKLVLEHLAVVI